MSTNETYNGWTNYATWRVNLEVCDDLCNSWHADRETFEDVSDIAERLKDETEEIVTNYGTLDGLAVDYAMAFLSDVNWYEIAFHWTDELVTPETVYCQECGEAEVDPESKYGNCTDCMEKYDHLAEVPV